MSSTYNPTEETINSILTGLLPVLIVMVLKIQLNGINIIAVITKKELLQLTNFLYPFLMVLIQNEVKENETIKIKGMKRMKEETMKTWKKKK
ncbi:hypothetical protein RhiirC2_795065 [Rhizophagus irregularis]|uniref:Uncharacterized protein n=1 Tax=Rhizophagus irregularis TaxID=588596 RepID=A0A2N1MCD8_9GLOM|nr:hypothetical protein RhiirC2_795065 [Rhizophagus irregularis]